MPFQIGMNLQDKFTGHKYKIIDITGLGKNTPSETPVVYLKLSTKAGFFSNAQTYITITGRELLNHFTQDTSR